MSGEKPQLKATNAPDPNAPKKKYVNATNHPVYIKVPNPNGSTTNLLLMPYVPAPSRMGGYEYEVELTDEAAKYPRERKQIRPFQGAPAAAQPKPPVISLANLVTPPASPNPPAAEEKKDNETTEVKENKPAVEVKEDKRPKSNRPK